MLQGYVHPDFGKVADMLSHQIPAIALEARR